VIRGGELVVVEEKARLMKTLGKKQLRLQLVRPLAAVPPELAGWALALRDGGRELEYAFDAREESSGVPELLRRLSDAGVELRDLETRQSTLEDIFVSLLHEPR
jgi:ABC-2 type transport system ATP-binding protein